MVQRLIRLLSLLGLALLLSSGFTTLSSSQPLPAPAWMPQVGDSFTLQATTRLRGTTGDYVGYTERERDRRTYTITSVENNVITWQVTSDFRYSDSDGGSLQENNIFVVKTEAQTRAYLEGTYDGPAIAQDYYTFDFAWFYLNPATVVPGTKLTILGNPFTATGFTTIHPSPLQAVRALRVTLDQGYSNTIQNDEYDPQGVWTLNVRDETYYYDPRTGYLLRADGQAEGVTSVGRFTWSEEVTLQASSFELQINRAAQLRTLLTYLGLGGLPVGLAIAYFPLQRWRWRRHVEQVLQFSQADRPRARTLAQQAVSAWNPASLRYEELLSIDLLGNAGFDTFLELRPGIYLVNDRNNRLGVVDTHANQYLPTQILPTHIDNLRCLYQLALGVLRAPEVSGSPWPEAADLATYAVPSRGFSVADPHSLEVYAGSTQAAGSAAAQAARQLLARRRVLDYTLGQAPLSPLSHLKKVEKILQENPRRVLLVGDDDLVSISLARQGIPTSVLELDPYTCALIRGIATLESLPITLWQHDLRRALPRDLGDRFDLFVTDADFTIESFFLFLTRGLSCLSIGGLGLINFENRKDQRFKARYLLEKLNIEILEEDQEQWNYTILRNTKVEQSRVRYGKHVQINYRDDIRLAEADYSSLLFRLRRQTESQVLLQAHEDFLGDERSIYDDDS